MGDIFSQVGTALQGSTGGAQSQAQQFDPNYGSQQQPRSLGEFISALLGSIGQRQGSGNFLGSLGGR
jgi:hypothetical protein